MVLARGLPAARGGGLSGGQARIALALASAMACRVLMAVASASTVALRSVESPIAAVQEDAEAGEGGAAAVSGGGGAAAGGEVELEGEDRRNRDTRLSRAPGPRIAGPRLRSL